MIVDLDSALSALRNTFPECLAAGLVDVSRREILHIATIEQRWREPIEKAASVAGELFERESAAIPRPLLRSKGDREGDELRLVNEIIVLSRDVVHMFQRCKKQVGVVLVTACRATPNLGIIIAGSRSLLSSVDGAATRSAP